MIYLLKSVIFPVRYVDHWGMMAGKVPSTKYLDPTTGTLSPQGKNVRQAETQ